MFVVDTHVVSELRKAGAGKADLNVAAWAASVPATGLFLSVITVLELEVGALLVERRDPAQGAILRAWLDRHVMPAFSGRVLSIDPAVARSARTRTFRRPRRSLRDRFSPPSFPSCTR